MNDTVPISVRPRGLSSATRHVHHARLFAGLDEQLLQRLERNAVYRTFARGERVWSATMDANCFTIIVTGLVKIVRPARDGEESIIGIFGPGESVGEAAVLEGGKYPADAVVASELAEILRVEASPVLSVLDTDPRVAAAMTHAVLEHSRALREKITIMSAGAVPRRLAALVLHLAERFGDELEDGSVTIPLPLRRTELARLIGATVETTIRVIRKWERDGLLVTTRTGFVFPDLEPFKTVTRGG